ncbi:hypothetical protein [Streptomyces sp. CAU 1734]|uniref:hypothetical protein n=1 Tax=Streptomyces sp. CAU 1734 TaxID=3140360 RepID=UPI00325FFB3B
MENSAGVDQHDVLRARMILLASGRRTPREEVDAYRVLARVSPAAYLPLLSRALRRLSRDRHHHGRPEIRLLPHEETPAAARAVGPALPARADVRYEALDGYQRELYAAGRRAEGLAPRAEMLALGRERRREAGEPVVRGLREWANGCSEAGRRAEAADALTEHTADLRARGAHGASLPEWAAAPDAAGDHRPALDDLHRVLELTGGTAGRRTVSDNSAVSQGSCWARVPRCVLPLGPAARVVPPRGVVVSRRRSAWAPSSASRSHAPDRAH